MDRLSYQLYEMTRIAFAPARAWSEVTRLLFGNPMNPVAETPWSRSVLATAELFERMTRRYGKPAFDLPTTIVDGQPVPVVEDIVWERPFCRLIHFRRDLPASSSPQPKLLIVAPMSGHYATLLRGTVEAFLPSHDVFSMTTSTISRRFWASCRNGATACRCIRWACANRPFR